VDQADARAVHLDDATLGQSCPQRRLVDVPEDRLDRCARLELAQHGGCGEVPGVQDQVGALELLDACLRQPASASRQVRVGEDRDPRQRARKRPSR
jgi:hypothetical protein